MYRACGKLALAMCVVALVASCSRRLPPEESCSFVQNPEQQRVSWKRNLPIKLYIHKSVPAEAYPSIDAAINELSSAVGGKEFFRVIARGVDDDLAPKKDGYSMIYWFKNWDANKPSEQARTTIYWSGVQIFEVDVRVNAANFEFFFGESSDFSQLDLKSLLVHELGHALGLAHNVAKGSVMNFSLNEGQDRRKLSPVDADNLRCEY